MPLNDDQKPYLLPRESAKTHHDYVELQQFQGEGMVEFVISQFQISTATPGGIGLPNRSQALKKCSVNHSYAYKIPRSINTAKLGEASVLHKRR